MRDEKDNIGIIKLNDDELYGINTKRSLLNFPYSGERVHPYLIRAYLHVKLAAVKTNFKCNLISEEKYCLINDSINDLLNEVEQLILNKNNSIYSKIVVDPYQGGAGTSLNMNINEVIANLSLKKMGKMYGEYDFIHPLDDVNLSQSTNDTFPTALKVASIKLLRELQETFSLLQNKLQVKEKKFSPIIKLGRTQLQDAVPISLGQEFGAYAQAIGRDRWRFYNAEERLRSVNLGGTAVGNSIAADRKYILSVVNELREITELPIAKAEDLIENTQNLDVFVEVHGIIKAGATSLIKISNDLRLLSSGPDGGIGEIQLPQRQTGSTIMPGKSNPVILENTIQLCEMVKAHDMTISNLVSSGNLELNQFLPMIAHLFLKSLTLLRDSSNNLATNCIADIKANKEKCHQNLINSKAILAALIPAFGYDKIADVAKISKDTKTNLLQVVKENLNINANDIMEILKKELGINIEKNS